MGSDEWRLPRAMRPSGAPEWDGAVWIGAIDTGALAGAPDRISLQSWSGEHRARLLMRTGMRVDGFITVPVADGTIRTADVAERSAMLGAGDDVAMPEVLPRVSIVLCTRDRAGLLAEALASIQRLDYPSFEVVVVDNAAATDATQELVRGLQDPRIRCITEPTPGLARARNTGVAHATGDIVAFTDDDVIVDPQWLRALAAAFSTSPAIGLVSGLVPSGEIRTQTQAFFDQRVTWSDAVRRSSYSIAHPPADMPLFPFQLGAYGTGANFALRRATIYQLGGFDEALGVGSRTGGGEDLDMFVRTLIAGWHLVVEPSAVIWHRHRADQAALEHQARGYGRGLGAWLAKVGSDPRLAGMALRRGALGLRRLASLRSGSVSASLDEESVLPRDYQRQLGRLEVRSMLGGPVAFAQERRAGAKARPLR